MVETNTSREERVLAENPRLKAACDAVGAKPGVGPCCMPVDIFKIVEAVDAYDAEAGASERVASIRDAVREQADSNGWLMAIRQHRMMTGSTLRQAKQYLMDEMPEVIPSEHLSAWRSAQ